MSRFDRISFMIALATVAVFCGVFALVAWAVQPSAENARLWQEVEAQRARAQLVRICASGDRLYRLDGRIVRSLPLGFEATEPGSTPDSLCPIRA